MSYLTKAVRTGALALTLSTLNMPTNAAPLRNGFDLENSAVPAAQIVPGGPPKDGIMAIDNPQFVTAEQANHVDAEDRVLGYTDAQGARAYPIAILNWHEVVNDSADDDSLIVTWCPLCGSGMAFRLPGREAFGVSGLLYNSDVLLYDRATESLWSQIGKTAISGKRRGQLLEQVLLEHTNWMTWREDHPQTVVLVTPRWRGIDYKVDPYAGYERSRRLYFPVAHRSRLFHPKERVLGLVIDGFARAYPLAELKATGGPVREILDGVELVVEYDEGSETAQARKLGEGGMITVLPATLLYWFAWKAFHPETLVYRAAIGKSVTQ